MSYSKAYKYDFGLGSDPDPAGRRKGEIRSKGGEELAPVQPPFLAS